MSSVSSIGGLNPNAIKESIQRDAPTQQEKIKRVGEQFEAVLLRQYLGDSLKPMFKGYLDEGGSINDTYRYFMTDILADSMSKSGGFGMGDRLAAQISTQDPSADSTGIEAASSEGNLTAPSTLSTDIRRLNPVTKINGTANAKQ